ncbi:MAG: flavodoxin [Desulfovibrionaceae bacterium]|nr:flavodoxin [Desulfovibrionaceae bacterium]
MTRLSRWAATLFSSCLLLSTGMLGDASAAPAPDKFLLLPGGAFQMGSPASERQRNPDEVRHEVHVSAFYVDPHEVTQADYQAVMGANPSEHKGRNLPVENVTWLDAVRFCNGLSEKRGLEPAYVINGEAVTWNRRANGYRLLTEAEWEYAARAGTDTPFNVGSQVHSSKVNFEATYPYLIEENYVTERDESVRPSHYRGRTIEVDELAPNAFGLHHTHGNVSEWVFDYYGAYDLSRTDNPAGPASGTYRVNRGGSYIDFGKHLRSAYRSATNPIDADPNLGFRICRSAAPLDETVETAAPSRIAMPARPRVLVAYYSYSGNTRRAAEYIAKHLGADLFPIRMKNPYGGNIYESSQLDLNNNVRPPLSSLVKDMAAYDVVILGYPTWWATMPMPVVSFLEAHDFRGKIVLPFSSHGGTVFGDSISDLGKTIPGAYVGIGFEFNYSGGRGLTGRLDEWLRAGGLGR